MIIEAQSDDEYYWSPKIQVGVDLGLSSTAELDEICDYFGCTYMELDSRMIEAYRDREIYEN